MLIQVRHQLHCIPKSQNLPGLGVGLGVTVCGGGVKV